MRRGVREQSRIVIILVCEVLAVTVQRGTCVTQRSSKREPHRVEKVNYQVDMGNQEGVLNLPLEHAYRIANSIGY